MRLAQRRLELPMKCPPCILAGVIAVCGIIAFSIRSAVAGTPRSVGDERNTRRMWGSGASEKLGREIAADLQAIGTQAIARAKQRGVEVALLLATKGVEFGKFTASPNGNVDEGQVEGVA